MASAGQEQGGTQPGGWLLPHFDNESGEGVVGVQYQQSGAIERRFLAQNGTPIYELPTTCSTCEILFEQCKEFLPRTESGATTATTAELAHQPDLNVLHNIGTILPPGDYALMLSHLRPRLLRSGENGDYNIEFVSGPRHSIQRPSIIGVDAAAIYHLGMSYYTPDIPIPILAFPLHRLDALDRAAIDRHKPHLHAGTALPILTLAFLDIHNPQDYGEYREQWQGTLSLFILDGHHRMQAGTELGVSVPVLSFISRDHSYVDTWDGPDFDQVLAVLARDLLAPANAE